MATFRAVRSRVRINGFHCHHLIPIEVVERRVFAKLFGSVRTEGFDPNDFQSNGMHLPNTEKQAAIFRMPLHRGPHPRYNEMV
ncbi:MAG: AHH domain-containing protein, partial [Sphingorhabdus sp.]